MSLYMDLSEFLAVPMKTGIQRISGEICRTLPPDTAIPVRLHAGRYIALPPVLIDVIGKYFGTAGDSGIADIRRLGTPEGAIPINISANDIVLVPDIFGEERAAFFRPMPAQELRSYRFIIYDLLPLTHPEYFPPYMPQTMFPYFHTVRRANCCGFISEQTRDGYYRRLRRTNASGGAVLPLGCDSLGLRVTQPAMNRPWTFTVLGTIEPRKNHALILDAFEPLLRQMEGLSLIFIGKMGWVDPTLAHRIRTLASTPNSGFQFFAAPDDGTIRDCVEQSRATIYISSAEGYGLPPVESLWLGTPVIASKTVPSLTPLKQAGIHYVEPLNAVDLRRAVLAFTDDTYANRKTVETMHLLQLPTWDSFTQTVLRWCRESVL